MHQFTECVAILALRVPDRLPDQVKSVFPPTRKEKLHADPAWLERHQALYIFGKEGVVDLKEIVGVESLDLKCFCLVQDVAESNIA